MSHPPCSCHSLALVCYTTARISEFLLLKVALVSIAWSIWITVRQVYVEVMPFSLTCTQVPPGFGGFGLLCGGSDPVCALPAGIPGEEEQDCPG